MERIIPKLPKPLSRFENKILRTLSNGFSYKETCRVLGISPLHLHAFVYRIRQKTKIRNTKDPEECKAWFDGVAGTDYVRTKAKGPSRTQLNVMTLLAMGKSYRQIGEQLKIARQTAQNHAFKGCKRAGITGQGHYRTTAIRDYIQALPPPRAAYGASRPDPMDDF